MPYPLETQLAEAWPPADWSDVTVLAAVSGGPDSVALLRALVAVKTGGRGRLCAAHLNHQLRPDAEADERFVVDLCGRLGVTCEVGRAAVERLAAQSGDGIEAAARTARYRFLEQTAGRLGARFVVTAHTADDQAETILHRILRGTGVRGISGMARARALGHASLLRPLLGIRRAEVLAYLDAIGQPYCSDQSNRNPRFTRNRIRRRLLPRLQREFNPDIIEALLRLGNLAGEAQAAVDRQVDGWFDRCVTIDGQCEAGIDLVGLLHLSGRSYYLVRELLVALWRRMDWPRQAMGRAQWDELGQMAASATSVAKRAFPGGVTVEVGQGVMRLRGQRPAACGGGGS
jgi:tRNA(Ile)-lysidine synthase